LSRILARASRLGSLLEDIFLASILGVMVLAAAAQIVLRNFLDVGFIWGDELLRMLVLWLAVGGAVAASRTDRHISIAVLDRFLPPVWQRLASVVARAFTCVVAAVVAWHALQFVLTSREYGDLILGGTPAWWLQSVLPLGFGLIAWRYLVLCGQSLLALPASSREPEEAG
jgi:TRAP-type C4-dicarboxylate transport system permease small subunit